MTTPTRETPRFQTTTRNAGFRAVVILGLCAALVAGFVATSARAPAPAVTTDTVACGGAGPGQKAC